MKCTKLFLVWLFYFEIFCVQNTSQGAPIATNSNGGPQGQREVEQRLILARAMARRKMQTAPRLKPET